MKQPINTNLKYLNGMPVFLSASIPEELMNKPLAQEVYTSLFILVQHIILSGGRIIFGGHPSITPLVRKASKSAGEESKAINLYQLKRFENDAPKDIWDTSVFPEIKWIKIQRSEDGIIRELTEMREAMAKASQAAIFIGGKTSKYIGERPGIRDEYLRFLKYHKEGPVYLIGYLQGETMNIIRELRNKKCHESNSLSDKERHVIYNSSSIELIISLIIKDLCNNRKDKSQR